MRASEPQLVGAWPRLRRASLQPRDPASLAFVRIAFGAILLWEVARYFQNGWIARYWIDPVFHFTYHGFSWVKPWPATGMYVHVAALALLALLILLGLGYRVATTLFFVSFAYLFFLEEARYLNDFYFLILLSFLQILVPANRALALDAVLGAGTAERAVPAWSIWILRFQLLVVYGFGGIAKLNGDWLRGEPLRGWIVPHRTTPRRGRLLRERGRIVPAELGRARARSLRRAAPAVAADARAGLPRARGVPWHERVDVPDRHLSLDRARVLDDLLRARLAAPPLAPSRASRTLRATGRAAACAFRGARALRGVAAAACRCATGSTPAT